MKNYFSFNLTGRKLFPIWILFLILFFAPYMTLVMKMQNIQDANSSLLLFFPLFVLLLIVAYLIMFYIAKLAIENIAFNDKSIVFNGTFGSYFGKILLGFFLSVITLGVYMAWFVRNIMSFFIDNSSYDSNAFKFKGKGSKLFVIILLTLFVPIILVTVIMTLFRIGNSDQIYLMMIIQQVAMLIIMIPYIYFVYKWMVNVDYKRFNISWETNFWNSCGKIAIEMILSIVTVGIYGPLAMVRLYKYFTEKTFAQSESQQLQFGYDIEPLNDFLFIWGQSLLTIITLGIYYPWAFSKIGDRILGKTYLVEK